MDKFTRKLHARIDTYTSDRKRKKTVAFYENPNIPHLEKQKAAFNTLAFEEDNTYGALDIATSWIYGNVTDPIYFSNFAKYYPLTVERTEALFANPGFHSMHAMSVLLSSASYPDMITESEAKNYFLENIPDELLTEDVLFDLLAFSSLLGENSFDKRILCDRARTKYGFDAALPDDWTIRALLGDEMRPWVAVVIHQVTKEHEMNKITGGKPQGLQPFLLTMEQLSQI